MVSIVAVGVLVFGFNAIQGFREQGDVLIFESFKNDITNDIRALKFGAVRVNSYEVPGKYDRVCFSTPQASQFANQELAQYPIINAAIQSGANDNVFLYPKGEESFFLGKTLDLGATEFVCFDVSGGQVKIKLTGQGGTVKIG